MGVAGGTRSGAGAIGHDARCEREFGVGVAVDQGQADDFSRLNGSAQYRVGRIDQRGSLSDCDGLSLRAHDQRDSTVSVWSDVEGDILLHKALKTGRCGLHDVIAHGKVIDAVLPIAVCRRRPRKPGIHIGCLHGGRVHHRALWILHCTHDGPGDLLSKRGDAARQNEDERHDDSRARASCQIANVHIASKIVRFRFV